MSEDDRGWTTFASNVGKARILRREAVEIRLRWVGVLLLLILVAAGGFLTVRYYGLRAGWWSTSCLLANSRLRGTPLLRGSMPSSHASNPGSAPNLKSPAFCPALLSVHPLFLAIRCNDCSQWPSRLPWGHAPTGFCLPVQVCRVGGTSRLLRKN